MRPLFSIIPGGQPGAAPLEDFGAQPAGKNSFTWTVDMAAGTSITFMIKDAAGAIAYSGWFQSNFLNLNISTF
jgi:hypothetical protein